MHSGYRSRWAREDIGNARLNKDRIGGDRLMRIAVRIPVTRSIASHERREGTCGLYKIVYGGCHFVQRMGRHIMAITTLNEERMTKSQTHIRMSSECTAVIIIGLIRNTHMYISRHYKMRYLNASRIRLCRKNWEIRML